MIFQRCAVFISLVLLAFAPLAESITGVAVQVTPSFLGFLPLCSASGYTNFETQLSYWVTSATRSISGLSDFTIPGGLTMAYYNTAGTGNPLSPLLNTITNILGLPPLRSRRLATDRALLTSKAVTAVKCTSAGCSTSIGLAVCKLCSGSRRHRLIRVSDASNSEPAVLKTNGDAMSDHDEGRRLVDWNTVAAMVTPAVQMMARNYILTNPLNGCFGNPLMLSLSVKFL